MSDKNFELLNEIQKKQQEFYSSSGKNIFITKSQKNNCAESISNNFNIHDLIKKTIFNIPNTNMVYMDYTLFKLYANPENFQIIVDHIFIIINDVIQKYDNYESHINLNSFTISATERYKNIIDILCKKCIISNTRYSVHLKKMCIYYSPCMIENIARLLNPFIDPLIKTKITLYNKIESASLLEQLFVSPKTQLPL